MKKQRQIEEAARLDGYFLSDKRKNGENTGEMVWFHKRMTGCFSVPPINYLTDYNAVHRLIRGIKDDGIKKKFGIHLASITKGISNYLHYWELCDATCAQMLEAILKAYEKWEDGE